MPPTAVQGAAVKSSLPYQLLLITGFWYLMAVFAAQALLFVYKYQVLPYATRNVVFDVLLLAATALIEYVRNTFGRRGNVCESNASVLYSLALTLPVFAALLYLLVFQTYVLRLELVAHALALAFLLLQTVFAVIAAATFSR